jgi:hypothetical protein
MATWKELRALQAAQQAAEAQRQTEARRGQREAQTWQQVLGTVDQLIGLAPQAIGAYETSEAQKVLAGERPLEREKPKDVLEGIAQFISSPFEGGVQRRAKAMAGEMAPAELAKLQPLTTQAVQHRLTDGVQPLDKREARKQISPEEFEKRISRAMPVDAAREILERSPALRLLPEREREAMAVGEAQRVQAEQAAAASASAEAERKARLTEADIALKEAKANDIKLKGSNAKAVDMFSAPLASLASELAIAEREGLTSTDVGRTLSSRRVIIDAMDNSLREMGQDPSSPSAQEAKQRALNAALKNIGMKELPPGEVQKLTNLSGTMKNLMTLDALREKAGWNPKKAEIIKQRIAERIRTPIVDIGQLLELATDVQNRALLSADELAFLNFAKVMQNRMALAEFAGTGAVGQKEADRVIPFVLNPWTTDVEWEKDFSIALQNMASQFGHSVRNQRSLYQVPQQLVDTADDAIEFSTSSTRDDALAKRLKESKAIMEAPATTTPPAKEKAYKDIGEGARAAASAPGLVLGAALNLDELADNLLATGEPEMMAAGATIKSLARQGKTDEAEAVAQKVAPAGDKVLVETTDSSGKVQQLRIPRENLQQAEDAVKKAGGSFRIIEGQ